MRGVVGDVAEEAERVFSGDVSEGSRGPCRDLACGSTGPRCALFWEHVWSVFFVCTQYVGRDAGNPVCRGGLWQEWTGLCAGARLCS